MIILATILLLPPMPPPLPLIPAGVTKPPTQPPGIIIQIPPLSPRLPVYGVGRWQLGCEQRGEWIGWVDAEGQKQWACVTNINTAPVAVAAEDLNCSLNWRTAQEYPGLPYRP